jgi:hypothetical protein
MRAVSNTLRPITDRMRESTERKKALLHEDKLLELLEAAAQACVDAPELGRKLTSVETAEALRMRNILRRN